MMFSPETARMYRIVASGHPDMIGLVGICRDARGDYDNRRLDLELFRDGKTYICAYGVRIQDTEPA